MSLVNLKGPIKFLGDSQSFVVCNSEYDEWQELEDGRRNYIYVWSTHHWRIVRKIVLDTFALCLQMVSASRRSCVLSYRMKTITSAYVQIPHPWTQVAVLKSVLLDGFFLFVEQVRYVIESGIKLQNRFHNS
jgi:hypothetical protein